MTSFWRRAAARRHQSSPDACSQFGFTGNGLRIGWQPSGSLAFPDGSQTGWSRHLKAEIDGYCAYFNFAWWRG